MNKAVIDQLDIKTKRTFEKLLKTSPPSREKRHALVRTLQREDSQISEASFNAAISSFYRLSYERRTAEQFRKTFGVKPYPWLLDQFSLSFRTAVVSETKVFTTATAFRHMIRNVISVPNDISSVDVFHLAVFRITRPRVDQLATGIGFGTFSRRWRDVVFFKFGSRYERFFDELDKAIEEAGQTASSVESVPLNFYNETSDSEWTADKEITQTDLDWLKGVVEAIGRNQRPPLYPLKRGPKVPIIDRIHKLVREAHKRHPFRHAPLEEAVLRSCRHFLNAYRQVDENEPKTA